MMFYEVDSRHNDHELGSVAFLFRYSSPFSIDNWIFAICICHDRTPGELSAGHRWGTHRSRSLPVVKA